MIVGHTRSCLSRCGNALQPSQRLYDSTRLVFGGHHPSRKFHASKPNLIVNEALQYSSELFYFIHNTSGLTWGLSIPLTAALCQLAFTPIHYWAEQNRKLRGHGANLLNAWRTIYREQQVLAQNRESSTEAAAAEAEYEVKKKLKAKGKQIQAEMGYKGYWLNYTMLTYIPVWMSNVGALVEMCGLKEARIVSASGTNGIAIEPALTIDGMLWFSDLTIADPTWLLPIAAGGMFVATVAQLTRNRTGPPSLLQDMLGLFALLSGPLFIATGVSNAVLLAMIGSTIVTIIRRSLFDKILGTTAAEVKPAKPRTSVLKKQYRLDASRQR